MASFSIHRVLITTVISATIISSYDVNAIELVDYNSISSEVPPIRFDAIETNPEFTFDVGESSITVKFGSHFAGQTLGTEPNTLDDSTPSAPLSLAADSSVSTNIDMGIRSIALGGMTSVGGMFTTPIAILFDQAVSAVGFRTGLLDYPNLVTFEAYDDQGNSLGLIKNPNAGSNLIGIGTEDSTSEIYGISMYLNPGEMDWEGFTIDDVIFSLGDDGQVPEPTGGLIWMVLGGCLLRYREQLS